MRTAQQAIAAANATRTNTPGMCQKVTRTWLGAPSAGDQDGDRDADAVDGWKSEPLRARHTDRRPAIGAPVAWSGGSGGFGHRALCVGYSGGEAQIRSTDAGGRGIVATKPLSWFERNWGLRYLGWSETMTGNAIEGLKPAPGARKPAPAKRSRGTHVDNALVSVKKAKAKAGTDRARLLKMAQQSLEKIPFLNKK